MTKHLLFLIALLSIIGCGSPIGQQYIAPPSPSQKFLLAPQKASAHEPLFQYAPYPLYPVEENYSVYGRYQ